MRLVGVKSVAVAAALVLFGQVVEARITSTTGYFMALRNLGIKFSSVGTVCEQVARLDLENAYDRELYSVKTNIVYGSRPYHTVGELDVVVFNRLSAIAIRIFEIKCWSNDRNHVSALNKAQNQREKFFRTMFEAPVEFWNHERAYSDWQFKKLPLSEYKTGGPRGALGFDYQLPLTQPQLEQLFRELTDCQRSGQCLKR